VAEGEHACPVCCAPASFRQASLKWSAVECSGCGHCLTLEAGGVSSDNAHFEDSGYVAWRERFHEQYETEAAARADFIEGKVKPGGRLLELGCSTGEFLHAMADKGWDAFGVDASAAAVASATRRYPNVQGAAGTEAVLLARGERASFDLIAAFHLIEHVRDLDTLLLNCRNLTAPGGSLVIFTPHWDSWSRRIFGDDWPDFMPEHVHFFTARSLSLLLARHGFRVVHVATSGTTWSWLGGMARVSRLRKKNQPAASGHGHGHPGRLKMEVLRAGNVLLGPLLRLEGKLGGGAELRVVAQAVDR
jgi:2-polyprenyl-3-methyl-5-hydroxy-6-metoxy-1,4-benzoquinol methylase